MNSTGAWVTCGGGDARQVGQQVSGHTRVGLQAGLVEFPRGEIHDRLVHAILDDQGPGEGPAVADHQPLEQAHAQTLPPPPPD